jgi:hypothetical protein
MHTLIPLCCEVAAISRRTRHLLKFPDSHPMVDHIYKMNGIDSNVVYQENHATMLSSVSSYCDAWNLIVKRFERGDYTLLQPAEANS